MELEPTARHAPVAPELDDHGVGVGLEDPGTFLSLTIFTERPRPDRPSAVVELYVVIPTPGAVLHVDVGDDEVEAAALTNRNSPGALRLVVVGLGIVRGADTASGCREVSSTSCSTHSTSCLLPTISHLWRSRPRIF